MFQKKTELLTKVIKNNGLSGLVNLGRRYVQGSKYPEKVDYDLTSMQVELTTACNLRCTMCSNKDLVARNLSLNFEDFKTYLDSAPYVELINFTGIGEILLNPDVYKILEYTKKKGIYVWFNDNFTLLNAEKAQQFIDMGIDTIAISFDGATKETFEGIRIGAKFETVIGNVKRFIEVREKSKTSRPELFFVYVVMKENIHEMEKMIELAKETGVDKVMFVGVLTTDEIEEKNLRTMSNNDLSNIFDGTQKKADELGIEILGLPTLPGTPKSDPACVYPWVSSYVTSEGDVLPCCFIKQGSEDHVNAAKMGNIKEEAFPVIWKNKKYQGIRKLFREGGNPSFCNDCFMIKRD